MYVTSRSIPTPPVSGFGGFGSGGTGIDAETFKASLLECMGASLFGGVSPQECAWQKVKEIVLAMPEAEAILTALATSDCSTAMAGLGLDSMTSAAACGALTRVWPYIRRKARDELIALRQRRTTLEDRPVENGGGVVIGEEGQEPRIACAWNEPGGPTIIGAPGDTSFQCPPGSGGVPAAGQDASTSALRFRARKFTKLFTKPFFGRITGRVTDEGGNPIAGAEIRVGDSTSKLSGTTDATGAFSVPASATSGQSLYISAPGYQDAVVQDLSVTAGGSVDIGAVALAAVSSSGEPEGGEEKSGGGGESRSRTWLFVLGGLAIAGGVGYLVYRSREGR